MKKIFNLLHWLRKVYWKIFNIKTAGVRIIIKNDGKFLLVKHRYGIFWVFPGGGIKKGESPEEACVRESSEEVRIKIKNFEKILGTYRNTTGGKNDTVTVCVANEWTYLKARRFNFNIEIKETKFFDSESLPQEISSATKRRLIEYLSGGGNFYTGDW